MKRREGDQPLRCLFASCIVLSTLAANVFADPEPTLVAIDISKTKMSPGDVFDIKVTVKNDGTAASKGGITLSFPERSLIPDIIWIRSDATGPQEFATVYPAGSQIYSVETKGVMTSTDLMAEAWYDTPWQTDENHWLSLRVRPNPKSQTCNIYIRANLIQPGMKDDVIVPQEGEGFDQQGYPVIVKTVEVAASSIREPLPVGGRTQVRRPQGEVYTVFLHNRYSTFDADEGGFQAVRRAIDQQIKEKVESFYPGVIQIKTSESPHPQPLSRLTKQDVELFSAEISFLGEIHRTQSGIDIHIRVYSKTGSYLSDVISSQAKLIDELPSQYARLILENFPLKGKVTNLKGKQVEITLSGGDALAHFSLHRRYLWKLSESGDNFEVTHITYQPEAAQLTGALANVPQSLKLGASVISLAGIGQVVPTVLQLLDRKGNELPNCQVHVSPTSDSLGEFAGLTDHEGKITLSSQGGFTLYVTVKRQQRVIGRFEVAGAKDPLHIERLDVESSELK